MRADVFSTRYKISSNRSNAGLRRVRQGRSETMGEPHGGERQYTESTGRTAARQDARASRVKRRGRARAPDSPAQGESRVSRYATNDRTGVRAGPQRSRDSAALAVRTARPTKNSPESRLWAAVVTSAGTREWLDNTEYPGRRRAALFGWNNQRWRLAIFLRFFDAACFL